jgi:hypothetical protein
MSDKTLKPDLPSGVGLPLAVLKSAAGTYAKAVGGRAVDRLTERAGSLTDRLTEFAEGGGSGRGGKGGNGDGDDGKDDGDGSTAPADGQDTGDQDTRDQDTRDQDTGDAAEGASPIKAGLSMVGSGIKDKVKGVFSRGGDDGGGGGGKGGGRKKFKFNNIVEAIDVGAPVDVVYDAWTTYDDWPNFMKKVERAELDPDQGKAKFKGQVFWSHREWETTIKEQVPDRRIVWDSSGPKGHISGAVTFHELAEELTRIVVILEYYPQGFMEKTANIWRAANRRMRLELKFFVRHVMTDTVLHPEDVEGYHAEIHDKEIVRSHDDVLAERDAEEEGAEEEGAEEEGAEEEGAEEEGAEEEGAGYDEEYEAESGGEGAEGQYDAGGEYDAEGQYDEEAPEDEGSDEEYGDEYEDEAGEDEAGEDETDDEADDEGDYAEGDYADEEGDDEGDETQGEDQDEEEADDEAASQEPAPSRRRSRR